MTYVLTALIFLVGAALIHQWDYLFQDWLQPYRIYGEKGTWYGDLLRVIRPFGKGNVIIVLALFIGAFGLKRRAIEMLTALAIVGILVFPTKKIVGRTRPSVANNDSFPSGDTAGITAATIPLMAQSAKFIPVAGLLIPAVAVLRVFDNNHYLSDVFAGVAFGLIAGAIAMALGLDKRWFFPKLKYRYLALLSVSLSMRWYVPALIRGQGTFFDFAMLFGPILIYGLSLVYLPFRYQWPRGYTPAEWKRFSWLRTLLISGSERLTYNIGSPWKKHGLATALFLLMALTAIASCAWSHRMLHLKLALAGIILLMAFIIATVYTLKKEGRRRYAACATMSGIVLVIFFFAVHLLPAAGRYHRSPKTRGTVTRWQEGSSVNGANHPLKSHLTVSG